MNGQMLAAVYYGPQDLRVERRPVPQPGPGDVLVRVRSAGICGTDLRIYHGGHRMYAPGTLRVPGHEAAGEVAAVGREVQGLSTGQPVFVAPNYGCGRCRQCITGNNNRCANYGAPGITIDGAFAEYMLVPAASVVQGNLIPIEAQVDPAAAALIEPFACVLRGQAALHITATDVVLIVGAGPIGIMHLLAARLQGARRVIVSENNPERATQAARFGAHRVVIPHQEDLATAIAEETGGEGADAIVVAAPAHSAFELAPQLAAIGGRINFFGGLPKDRPAIQLDANLVHYKELVVTGTTASSTADCWRASNLVNAGKIDLAPLVSARFPLQEAVEAIEAAGSGKLLKVVIEP